MLFYRLFSCYTWHFPKEDNNKSTLKMAEIDLFLLNIWNNWVVTDSVIHQLWCNTMVSFISFVLPPSFLLGEHVLSCCWTDTYTRLHIWATGLKNSSKNCLFKLVRQGLLGREGWEEVLGSKRLITSQSQKGGGGGVTVSCVVPFFLSWMHDRWGQFSDALRNAMLIEINTIITVSKSVFASFLKYYAFKLPLSKIQSDYAFAYTRIKKSV